MIVPVNLHRENDVTPTKSFLLLSVLFVLLGVPEASGLAGSPVSSPIDAPIQPPLPVWPSDDETMTDRRPTYRLNGRHQATRYIVEVDDNPEFNDPSVLTDAVVEPGPITPVVTVPHEGDPLDNGVWYWRAFAENDEGYRTTPANYRVFKVADQLEKVTLKSNLGHPRILLLPGRQEEILRRIERTDHLRRGWQYQVNAARGILAHPPLEENYAAAGEGQHGHYSTVATWYHRHMENVAFVGHLTDDPRMIRKGIDMLMTICGYERWLGPLFDDPDYFDPVWNSALETAMTTEAVAISYDLLHDHLTEEQRRFVRDALVEKGIRPLIHDWVDPVGASQIPRHQLPNSNWVMVCTGSAGLGALAILGEHPDAERWVRQVRDRTRAWFKDRGNDYYADAPNPNHRPDPIPVIGPTEPNFGVDGGYKESISYMNYGSRYGLFFADALKRSCGEDLFGHVPEGIFDVMAWSLMAYPLDGGVETRLIDFGDSGTSVAWYGDLLTAMIANRRDPLAAWLYRRVNPVPSTPRSLLWYDPSVIGTPPDTTIPMGVFRGIGQVIMRQGWGPDTPMAAIKFHQNRGHHDLGTVFLYGQGRPTLIDSGSSHYGHDIYRRHGSRSIGHNVVLVDNTNQRWTDGKMIAAVSTSQLSAASGQLAAAYPDKLESWTRDLIMLPNRQALILDQLEAAQPHQFDLILHPENPFTIADNGALTIGSDPVRALISVYSDGAFETVEQDGYFKTLPYKYVRMNAAERATSRTWLTLCRWLDPTGTGTPLTMRAGRAGKTLLLAGDEPPPTDRPVGDADVWRIDQEDAHSRLSIRIGPSATDSVRSDARVTAVWQSGRRHPQTHAVMLAGRSLAVDGQELVTATRPVSLAIETGMPTRLAVWAPEPARLTLAIHRQAQVITLNGLRSQSPPHRGLIAVDVPAGESILYASDFDRTGTTMPPVFVDDLLAVDVPEGWAFREQIITRASSSYSDVINALDGDPNTAWHSIPGLPMPQWCEVHLPEAQSMQRIALYTRYPASGYVEGWEPSGNDWTRLGTFRTDTANPSAEIHFERRNVQRIRVTFDAIDEANSSVTLYSLTWN